MKEVMEEEKLDEFGKPKKSNSAKRKRSKPKAKPVNSDPEDSDFSGSDDTSSDDSDIQEVIPNEEIASSLPTRTHSGKAPARKKAKPSGKTLGTPQPPPPVFQPVPSTSTSDAGPSTSTTSEIPAPPPVQSQTAQKKAKGPGVCESTLASILLTLRPAEQKESHLFLL
ncbi:hypothetical protein B0H14DRAFT_2570401 [Mycena olivaceomarginata]|nr:hypothetical protein B0H14DRAFT_2570401 [Mycena olivaceomarginata]